MNRHNSIDKRNSDTEAIEAEIKKLSQQAFNQRSEQSIQERCYDLMRDSQLPVDVLSDLLDNGIMDANYCDIDGFSLLHIASLAGNADYCQLLLKHGAHVNGRSREGTTALENASVCGSLKTAKILVEKGAELHPGLTGPSAITEAAFRGHYDILEYLLKMPKSRLLLNYNDNFLGTPLTAACISECDDQISAYMAKILILAGARVNEECRMKSPLHHACSSNKLITSRLLIFFGANFINCRDDCKKLPIDSIPAKYAPISKPLLKEEIEQNWRVPSLFNQSRRVAVRMIKNGQIDVNKTFKYSKPMRRLCNLEDLVPVPKPRSDD